VVRERILHGLRIAEEVTDLLAHGTLPTRQPSQIFGGCTRSPCDRLVWARAISNQAGHRADHANASPRRSGTTPPPGGLRRGHVATGSRRGWGEGPARALPLRFHGRPLPRGLPTSSRGGVRAVAHSHGGAPVTANGVAFRCRSVRTGVQPGVRGV